MATHFHFPACPWFSVPRRYVVCGLRREKRSPLRRSQVLSGETIRVVQSLKFAKSTPGKVEEVLKGKLTRLLKSDMLDTLAELQRQNELDLALKVFRLVKKEVWYKPDISLYCDMLRILGKNKIIPMVEELLSELMTEGIEPDTMVFTEMIGAYLTVDMIDEAMEIYGFMKESGCFPNKLTFTILIKNLERAGKEELASLIKKECANFMEYPEKFLQELAKSERKKTAMNMLDQQRVV